MVDYFGNELHLGSIVAFVLPYENSKSFKSGKVIEFTKKMVRVEYRHINDMCPSYVLKYPTGLILKK